MELQFKEIKIEEVNLDLLFLKIEKSLSSILKNAHSSIEKQKLVQYHDRFSFACPYCKDSDFNKRKKRGNFYNNFTFKCYNCGNYRFSNDFFRDFNVLDEFTFMEIEYMKANAKTANERGSVSKIIETVDSSCVEKYAIPRNALVKKLKLKEVCENAFAFKWLSERKQPLDLNSSRRFAYDSVNNKIYIFNLTKDFKKIIGLQIRQFGASKANAKYLTFGYDKICKDLLGIDDISKEALECVNPISKLFNVLNIKFGNLINIFEGPLDAFLLDNSIATCGSNNDVIIDFEPEAFRYFQDNDSAGLKIAIKKLEAGFSVFKWQKFLKDFELENKTNKQGNSLKDLTDVSEFVNLNQINIEDYFTKSKTELIWV